MTRSRRSPTLRAAATPFSQAGSVVLERPRGRAGEERAQLGDRWAVDAPDEARAGQGRRVEEAAEQRRQRPDVERDGGAAGRGALDPRFAISQLQGPLARVPGAGGVVDLEADLALDGGWPRAPGQRAGDVDDAEEPLVALVHPVAPFGEGEHRRIGVWAGPCDLALEHVEAAEEAVEVA